jgi:hypothetical protein
MATSASGVWRLAAIGCKQTARPRLALVSPACSMGYIDSYVGNHTTINHSVNLVLPSRVDRVDPSMVGSSWVHRRVDWLEVDWLEIEKN